jgi:hypothetical protein
MKWSKTIATVVDVVVGAVPLSVDSTRPPKGISEPQENLQIRKRTMYVDDSLFMGTQEHIKTRRISPWHKAVGFFTQREPFMYHKTLLETYN